jgi:hypothetical protein
MQTFAQQQHRPITNPPSSDSALVRPVQTARLEETSGDACEEEATSVAERGTGLPGRGGDRGPLMGTSDTADPLSVTADVRAAVSSSGAADRPDPDLLRA